MNPTALETAEEAVHAGLERIARSPAFESPAQERAYRGETIETFRRALALSPNAKDEVLARLCAAIEFVNLENLEGRIVERIRAQGIQGTPDAYAGVSWFREAAAADRKHGVRLWDEEGARWIAACDRIDICVKLFGDHKSEVESKGAARMWWESFTGHLDHLESTVLPTTYLSLGNLLAADGESVAARACYARCLHPSNTDSSCRKHAEHNLALLESGEKPQADRGAGFRGSSKVLLVLGVLAALSLLAKQVGAAFLIAGIAAAYWWFKSRS